MKKQIKGLIVAAMMVLALPLQAFAASEAAASINANGAKADVSVTLQHEGAGEDVTALQMTLDVQATVGSLNQAQVSFEFDKNLPGTVQRYSYNQEKHTLTIYVAGAKSGLFTNNSVDLGDVKVSSNTGDYIQVSVTAGQKENDLQILSGGTNLKPVSMQTTTAYLEAGKAVTPTETPQPTAKPSATATPTAKPSATATPTAKPSATATPTAKPGATATPTAKPSATATPTAKPGATAVPTTKPDSTANSTTKPGASTAPTVNPNSTATATPSANSTSGTTSQNTTVNEAYTASEVEKAFAEQGGVVELNVADKTVIDAKAFALLKDTADTTLKLAGKNYVWNFKSSDITDTSVIGDNFNSAINFTVNDTVKKKIESLVEGNSYVAFETAYSGKLPGTATLQLQLDKAIYADQTLELYYQPENGDAELVSEVNADENGMVSLSLDHCSVYFLAIKTNAANGNDASQSAATSSAVVVTENSSNAPVIAGVIAIVAIVVIAVVLIRRRNNND